MKKTFTILLFSLFMFSPLFIHQACFAQETGSEGVGVGWTRGMSLIETPNTGLPGDKSTTDIAKSILSWMSAILATVFMLVAVAAGLTMMFSVGGQDTFDKARKWLTYAIVGLIIALLAYTIINTIGARLGLGA